MHALNTRFLASSLMGTVVTVLAGMLLAPSVARASCGDYLLMGAGAKSADHAHSFPQLPGSRKLPSTPHDGPKPCSGPLCSQSPLPLPAVPPLVTAERESEHALSTFFLFLAEATPNGRYLDDFLGQPVRRGASIYHPPRSGGSGVSL
jgi:hypothetical protein